MIIENIEARQNVILNRFTLECGKYLPGPGWLALLEELIFDLDAMGVKYDVAQIKEKFGTLRFYVDFTNQEQLTDDLYNKFMGRIDRAEELSGKTCERCGDPGKMRSGGWIKTLCDGCDTKPVNVL